MKHVCILIISSWLCLVISTPVFSEMVSIGKRYFIDRENISGQLYSSGEKKGKKIQADIKVGGMSGWTIKVSCDDQWDWKKVEKATKKIRVYINNKDDINPLEMLIDAGLSGCTYKK